MARLKKITSHYDAAVTRLAAMKSIDEKLDLGNGLTVEAYEKSIDALRDKINAYNTMLSELDRQLSEINESEKALQDYSDRMLTGVAAKYGKNSNEYEQAGGVKKSNRKRSPRKKADK
jgi:uncharacterized protein YukE